MRYKCDKIMKIAIIAAMRKEIDLLLTQINGCAEKQIGDVTIYEGQIGNHDIILSQCGIGKVNSALRTRMILAAEHPDLVLNSGVAGGVDESMKIGDVLVAERVAYHDVWCGPGTEYGQADGCPLYFAPFERGLELMRDIAETDAGIRFGLLCSGDKFITTPDEVKEIKSHFPDALGCDMESASIAQTCLTEGVPFLIVRVMSDRPGSGENISEYKNFWTDAPAKTFRSVSGLIEKL